MFGLRSVRKEEAAPAAERAMQKSASPPATRPQSAPEPADLIHNAILARIDPASASSLSRTELTERVQALVGEIANDERLVLADHEQETLVAELLTELIGFGPLDNLLRDDSVSDILVNGPRQIYVERHGVLELTGLQFHNDRQVIHLAQRIAASIGRRVDESSPMLDARLADGSRVNVIIPPAILSGPSISIRKFNRAFLNFPRMTALGSISPALGRALEIAARCRLNILISGGTGSGKTTLLNAMSGLIDARERVVTIEDTAELQMQQPHVLRLESRPPGLDGKGEITQRDLVRNALRMRPDRIVVGEVRGPEAFDMMQAMNTGHNGSMSTIHANSARDALARLENMVLIANTSLPLHAIRSQIVSALHLVLQIERLRDGSRRVTELSEVVGMEGEVVTLSPLFSFEFEDENADGTLNGTFVPGGIRPRFLGRLKLYGLAEAFMKAITPPD